MARRFCTIVFLGLSVFLFGGLLYGQSLDTWSEEYLTLDQLLSRTDAVLQWDAAAGEGVLRTPRLTLGFFADMPWITLDYAEYQRAEPVRFDNGELLFPESYLGLLQNAGRGIDMGTIADGRRVAAIFIDPGHGGRDPGAIGRHTVDGSLFEIHEKDIVLDVGVRLYTLLRASYPDRQIILSRVEDSYLTLEERTNMANDMVVADNEVVLFVSLHANASLNTRATGFEVWYLSPEVSRGELISRRRTQIDDPALISILNTLRDEELTIESILLARSVLDGLDGTVGSIAPNRGMKMESWYVVRNAKMPSILVELGFVTNREEAVRLSQPEYLHKLTRGIYNGIHQFITDFEE